MQCLPETSPDSVAFLCQILRFYYYRADNIPGTLQMDQQRVRTLIFRLKMSGIIELEPENFAQ
jgi:hypothetical protein